MKFSTISELTRQVIKTRKAVAHTISAVSHQILIDSKMIFLLFCQKSNWKTFHMNIIQNLKAYLRAFIGCKRINLQQLCVLHLKVIANLLIDFKRYKKFPSASSIKKTSLWVLREIISLSFIVFTLIQGGRWRAHSALHSTSLTRTRVRNEGMGLRSVGDL